jgi:hypothetical protein
MEYNKRSNGEENMYLVQCRCCAIAYHKAVTYMGDCSTIIFLLQRSFAPPSLYEILDMFPISNVCFKTSDFGPCHLQ